MASDDKPLEANIAAVVDRFGGPTAMAKTLSTDEATVRGWIDAAAFPADWHERILIASDEARLGLGRRDVLGKGDLAAREIDATAETVEDVKIPDAPAPTPQAQSKAAVAPDPEPTAEAEVEVEDDDAHDDDPAPRARGGGFALFVSVLALIVGGGALTKPLWTPMIAQEPWAPPWLVADAPAPVVPPEPDTAALDAALSQMSAEIAVLRSRIDETTPMLGDDGGLDVIRSEFDALRARIDAVASEPELEPAEPGVTPSELAALKTETEAALADAQSAQAAALDQLRADFAETLSAQPDAAEIGALSEAVATDIAALSADLDALRAQSADDAAINALRDQLAEASTANGAALGALRARLDAFDGRIAAADRAAKTLAAAQEDALAAIADLKEASVGMAAAEDAALLLAAGQLRDAALGGSAFTAELETVKALAGGDAPAAAIATLEEAAALGAPTLGRLRAQFAPIARAAAIAAAETVEDGDFVDRTMARLGALVVVRPTGGDAIEGDDPPARLARAEADLEGDDLAGAVDALKGLSGPAAKAVADWLTLADRRLSVQAALSELTAALIAQVGRS